MTMGWVATFFFLTTLALWYYGSYDRFGYIKHKNDWQLIKARG